MRGLKVPLTKKRMASVASSRSRNRSYLDDEWKKKQSVTQDLKRKVQEEIEDRKKKRTVLTEMYDSLQTNADELAEQAGGKSRTYNEKKT